MSRCSKPKILNCKLKFKRLQLNMGNYGTIVFKSMINAAGKLV